jgi:hypothetical protein
MRALSTVRLLALSSIAVLSACGLGGADGGRGSSGFDFRENAIIDRVLRSQVCVNGRWLTFCPADQRHVDAATPTAAPTAPTPTIPSGPTATATPEVTMRVDTQVAAGASVVCTRDRDGAPCALTFSFAGIGFPHGAVFRVASRLRTPDSAWQLAAPPAAAPGDPPLFDTVIRLQIPAGATPRVQFAVLVFLTAPTNPAEHFESLAQSGADLAFVTGDLVLETITIGPPPTATATPQDPATPTATPAGPTPTPTEPAAGPEITYFGVTRADSYSLAPSGYDGAGRPIYVRPFGYGLSLVVEGRPGASQRPVGRSAFAAPDAPDLQIILDRPLGDGSSAVCDRQAPAIGGVPAVSPFAFADTPAVLDAMNDVGCRVDDGQGSPLARSALNACTLDRSGEYAFVGVGTTAQFCLPIAGQWSFQPGDTIVAARLRDTSGALGARREIVIRNAAPAPPATPTASPARTAMPPTQPPTATSSAAATATEAPSSTPTPTGTPVPPAVGPQIVLLGVSSADNQILTPSATDPLGRPVFRLRTHQGFQLIVEAKPGADRRPVGGAAYNADGAPDLQMIASRPLGDGSALVCDIEPPLIGGVPATMPFGFADDAAAIGIINDLGCRVDDGAGEPRARLTSTAACTRSRRGNDFGYAFVQADASVQYCLPIARAWAFPAGDTIVAARLRDLGGQLGAAREIVIRIEE